jgi:hypothetical protein
MRGNRRGLHQAHLALFRPHAGRRSCASGYPGRVVDDEVGCGAAHR